MAGDAAQSVGADVTFADVPVAIDAGVVDRARIVEVNGANVLDAYRLVHALNQRVQTVLFADVVTCCEGVRGVEADSERNLRAHLHEQREMFETVADAIALSGCVFKQDSQRATVRSEEHTSELQSRLHLVCRL